MPTTACLRRSGLNYVSRRDVLEHLLLQREIGHKATQPSVLALQLLQAFGLLKLQAPILPAPAIITLLGDAGLLTGKRQALSLGELHLNLTQHGDDLLGAEPLPSGHLRLLSFQVNPLNQPSINPVQKEPVRLSSVAPMKRLSGICRTASENLSPIRAMHTGMIPPAATPPTTRVRKRTSRSGAKA